MILQIDLTNFPTTDTKVQQKLAGKKTQLLKAVW
jgi:hypothetical protein